MPNLSRENACPNCGQMLSIKLAEGGEAPGTYFMRCVHCKYFYRFTTSEAQAAFDNGWRPQKRSPLLSAPAVLNTTPTLASPVLQPAVPAKTSQRMPSTSLSTVTAALRLSPPVEFDFSPGPPSAPLCLPSLLPIGFDYTFSPGPPSPRLPSPVPNDWLRDIHQRLDSFEAEEAVQEEDWSQLSEDIQRELREIDTALDTAVSHSLNDLWTGRAGSISPQKPRRQGQAMKVHLRNFWLVIYNQNDKPPTRLCIQSPPRWPSWSLDDDPELLPSLAKTEDSPVIAMELYSQKLRWWSLISLSHSFQLSSDCVIILRRSGGSSCPDLKDMTNVLDSTELHIHNNMRGERKAVHNQLKNKSKSVVEKAVKWKILPDGCIDFTDCSDSDSDKDVAPPSKKRKRTPLSFTLHLRTRHNTGMAPCLSIHSQLWAMRRNSEI
ncbi:hypothetical protein K435DRAFT_794728 [Dendrothele bispora CBS 962.96]|uniref:Uncharacterized protein n=1 Tax=Dendrothele bispora (strain CBS 962.96) TaxID=1314807 RepID=A0A4S8MB31_DENBC|nr:hypothetical protein K435DRAFT_794728 [Dendrothele bispora CBS 962.96]